MTLLWYSVCAAGDRLSAFLSCICGFVGSNNVTGMLAMRFGLCWSSTLSRTSTGCVLGRSGELPHARALNVRGEEGIAVPCLAAMLETELARLFFNSPVGSIGCDLLPEGRVEDDGGSGHYSPDVSDCSRVLRWLLRRAMLVLCRSGQCFVVRGKART